MIFVNYFLKKVFSRWFGAYYIDPKHLVFVVGVQTGMQKDRLRANDAVMRRTRELLR